MSKIKSERAYATKRFDRFVGIGDHQSLNAKKSTSLVNFRLTSDGTLKKRNGYRLHRELPRNIRAYWEGAINRVPYVFAICDNTIYQIDYATSAATAIDTVTNTYADLEFFLFEDTLYLPDGTGLRAFSPATVSFPYVTPYVPLYGKAWDPIVGGSMNEPFNLLTTRIRVQYTNTTGATTFQLPFYARSVDGVKVNGRSVNYSFTSLSDTFSIPAESTGMYVEVAFDVVLEADTTGISSAIRAAVCTNQSRSTLCLYGAETPYKLYLSSAIPAFDLSSCRTFYSDVKPIYFKDSDILFAGDAGNPITAVCPYQDRTLVYTRDTLWQIYADEDASDTYEIIPLLRGIGCVSHRAATVCGGTPITVNEKGIFQLRFSSDKREPPTYKNIAGDIKAYLTDSFVSSCVVSEDQANNELWLVSPESAQPIVLVYHLELGEWYLFDNIDAEFFFALDTCHCFVSGSKIYAFENDSYDDAGQAIIASMASTYFDFSHPEALKRALRVTVSAQTNGAPAYLHLETERTERTFELLGKESPAPEIFDSRALVGRFRTLRFRIMTEGVDDFRLYSVTFLANL